MELLRGKYKAFRVTARFEDVGGLVRPNFSRPLWKGEDLNDKTILITDEQGFGDTLMLARYLPPIKRAAQKSFCRSIRCSNPIAGWPGADKVITHGTGVPDYDCYASVFDLPYIFGTTLETVPAQVPYLPMLAADEKTACSLRVKLKVGVVCGGSLITGTMNGACSGAGGSLQNYSKIPPYNLQP